MSRTGLAAIRAFGLGKRYHLGGIRTAERFITVRDAVASWLRGAGDRSAASAGSIWALKDVSFQVNAGEVLGIIGHNGAGKSTLCKILSRITEPTEGEAELMGRVGSLLEVGTGFHLELNGRENVYLSGAVLGMKRSEIARKFDDIVNFAEVQSFLDTPVKHYSNGMYTRLAFAVAAYLEPDTLIIDEVLAVGDLAFQKKCLGKMGEVAKDGRTILFVSHNLGAIRSMCTRALVLEGGRLRFDGAAPDAIAYYLSNLSSAGDHEGQIEFGKDGLDFQDLRIHKVRIVNERGEARGLFDASESVRVEIEYEVLRMLRGLRTVLAISTPDGELAFQSTDHAVRDSEQEPGRYNTSCAIPAATLNRRMYLVELSLSIPGLRVVAPRRPYVSFVVSGVGNHGSIFPEPWPGVVCPKLEWQTVRM